MVRSLFTPPSLIVECRKLTVFYPHFNPSLLISFPEVQASAGVAVGCHEFGGSWHWSYALAPPCARRPTLLPSGARWLTSAPPGVRRPVDPWDSIVASKLMCACRAAFADCGWHVGPRFSAGLGWFCVGLCVVSVWRGRKLLLLSRYYHNELIWEQLCFCPDCCLMELA